MSDSEKDLVQFGNAKVSGSFEGPAAVRADILPHEGPIGSMQVMAAQGQRGQVLPEMTSSVNFIPVEFGGSSANLSVVTAGVGAFSPKLNISANGWVQNVIISGSGNLENVGQAQALELQGKPISLPASQLQFVAGVEAQSFVETGNFVALKANLPNGFAGETRLGNATLVGESALTHTLSYRQNNVSAYISNVTTRPAEGARESEGHSAQEVGLNARLNSAELYGKVRLSSEDLERLNAALGAKYKPNARISIFGEIGTEIGSEATRLPDAQKREASPTIKIGVGIKF